MALSRYRPLLPFAMSAIFLIIGFCAYYVRLATVQNAIVVHFTGGQGADVLGTAGNAARMLLGGTAATLANFMIAAALWPRNRVLARLIGFMTAFMTLLILVAICGIITVN